MNSCSWGNIMAVVLLSYGACADTSLCNKQAFQQYATVDKVESLPSSPGNGGKRPFRKCTSLALPSDVDLNFFDSFTKCPNFVLIETPPPKQNVLFRQSIRLWCKDTTLELFSHRNENSNIPLTLRNKLNMMTISRSYFEWTTTVFVPNGRFRRVLEEQPWESVSFATW